MKKMCLKHKLCPAAREMNIVPGLHLTLVSVPKLADAGYTTVFSKKGAAIYDDHTTKITSDKPPVLEADRCNLTSLWKLPLHPEKTATNREPPHDEAINITFNLPSARQNFLWYHAADRFPPKETFTKAICNGNYATWPKLTVQLIHKYMPDTDETAKGHLKGQCQGVRSMKQKAFKKMIKVEEVRIKIEGDSSPFCSLPPTKLNNIFMRVEDLNEEIHNNLTGAFPPTSQRGNRSIQTFKAHFISILASINNKFPLLLWCHLLEPTELTLNLLCQSRVAPKILAFAHVHGTRNYIQKLFAPIGCVVQTHVKPNDRLSWDTRSEPGFNLGTSMEHHQCFRVYVTRTRATRISDTIVFKHQYITSPMISPESHVVAAAQQLVTALQGNIPAGNKMVEALTKVSQTFHKN
jgi:hypothetical protein